MKRETGEKMDEKNKENAGAGLKLKTLNQNQKLLPQRAADQITKMIADRQLKAGDKLPNEFDMAAQLNVGRGTIREAVKILVSRNVIEIRRGSGTFVCDNPGVQEDPFGFAFVEDKEQLALDLCEFRMVVEPEMAAMAAERATEEDILKMEEAAKEVEELCLQNKDHMERDIVFHELIAQGTKNQVMPNVIPVIQSAIGLFITVTDSSLKQETMETHRMVMEAIKNRDPQAAKAAMMKHLESNRTGILRAVEKNKNK